MTKIKALLSRLHCEYPIIGAPMAGISGGRLAAAATIAGGLGTVAVGYLSPEAVLAEIQVAELDLERAHRPRITYEDEKQEASLPIGVGFITWALQRQPSLLDVVLAANPLVYWFSFGDYQPYVARIRARHPHAIIAVQVDSVPDAIKASDNLVDIVVVQGLEAGGHGPKDGTSSFCLVPSVKAAFEARNSQSFIIAAGGVTNWRQTAAAFDLGAHGIVIGTRLTVSHESLLPKEAKIQIVQAGENSTVTTNRIDELRNEPWDFQRYTARALKSPITTDPNYPITPEQYQQSAKNNDFNVKAIFSGMGVNLVNELQSAHQIIHEIIQDYYFRHVQTRQRELWIPGKL